MRRPTAFSTILGTFKVAFAGAVILAAAVSCDTYTTSVMQNPPDDGTIRVQVHPVQVLVTAAQKDSIIAASAAEAGSFSSMVPIEPVSNVVAPTSAATSLAACGSGAGTFVGYSKSQVAFTPEAIPNVVPYPIPDDDWIPDSDIPLGFSFTFQGQTY